MNRTPSSIFNDVIGPVMIGPSSSHTAGPARIGRLAGQLVRGPVRKVTFVFETHGSFAGTYQGQKSDQGLVAGILGWAQDDERLPKALQEAVRRGMLVTFRIEDFDAPHPNTVKIFLESDDGETATATGLSVGGGVVEIVEVDGYPLHVSGGFDEHLVYADSLSDADAHEAEELYAAHEVDIEVSERVAGESGVLLNFKCRKPMPAALRNALAKLPWVRGVKCMDAVMPVLSSGKIEVPFSTAEEMRVFCEERGFSIWEAACRYEAERGGISDDEVFAKMRGVLDDMKLAVERGMRGGFAMRGFLSPSAGSLEKARRDGMFLPTGILDKALVRAVAVMEYNSSMGRIVAAPTAGSCGTLPALVLSAVEDLNGTEDDAVKALLVGGIIGVFIAEQATFAAEVCGCQAECGSAACMAAAAMAWLNGGNVAQCLNAASLALQNMLGLICDPVAEQVEIPCINRNVAAAANAVTAANMALFGFDAAIPLDEVIRAMFTVGKQLPPELRCTGRGGLCMTPTGQRLKREAAGREG